MPHRDPPAPRPLSGCVQTLGWFAAITFVVFSGMVCFAGFEGGGARKELGTLVVKEWQEVPDGCRISGILYENDERVTLEDPDSCHGVEFAQKIPIVIYVGGLFRTRVAARDYGRAKEY